MRTERPRLATAAQQDSDPDALPAPRVHPSAVVAPEVQLGAGSEVGPFCRLEGRVRVGMRCRFGTGAVIGSAPMDRNYRGEDTAVVIGSDNVFCEYVTANRATGDGKMTIIGDSNLVMAYVHIGHNCRIGSGCIITNGVQLAGHVEVGDRANIGGLTGIHQFCRVGELAMVGACSYVNKDVPPFVVAAGNPCRVRGLNLRGMERAGVPREAVLLLKQVYRLVYRSGLNLAQAVAQIEAEILPSAQPGCGLEQIGSFLEFAQTTRRGLELRTGDDSETVGSE
ncbi:MAG: acyl-ACP--UDP-N-acetylglucosamine O-acyltransferase [candidate division WOR-3 bacterium]